MGMFLVIMRPLLVGMRASCAVSGRYRICQVLATTALDLQNTLTNRRSAFFRDTFMRRLSRQTTTVRDAASVGLSRVAGVVTDPVTKRRHDDRGRERPQPPEC